MKRIHLETVCSTNDEIKRLMGQGALPDLSCLTANNQTAARGQRGNSWASDAGKNIALSMYKQFQGLQISNQFMISMAVSLALEEVFSSFLNDVSIKWPNDIMVRGKKIAGVLTETGVIGNNISWAIIGIGVNVQQDNFKGLPHASSFLLEGMASLQPETLLSKILPVLEKYVVQVEQITYAQMRSQYEPKLFGFKTQKEFKEPGEQAFLASVEGIDQNGALRLKKVKGELSSYQLKEVSMVL